MAKKPGKRKRSRVGRSVRRAPPRGRLRADDAELDEAPSREKMLRGSDNEGAPPEEASQAEVQGDVRAGRVVSLRGREAVVAEDDGSDVVSCLLRKSTRVPHPAANALAVGDRVRFLREGDPPFMLTEVRPRRTRLARVRGGRREHVIAANVDLCVIVASAAQPPFKPGLVDRYLISAREGGLTPALLLNKADLVTAELTDEALAPYRRLGLAALAVSAETGQGLDALQDLLTDKTAVFSGQSGVGKSSLLNRLVPDLEIATGGVYGKVGKGRHTTTASTLYAFPFGGAVIDTPGLRSFEMHAPTLESLHDFFPEIAEAAQRCRFADCSHRGDGGSAVPAAVEHGTVLPGRLDSYLGLRAEIEAG